MNTYAITDNARKVAQIAFKYKTRHHTQGGNYTGLEAVGAYENGTLGELYFYKLLKDRGIRSKYDLNLTGKADRGDFMLFYNSKPITVDVKTACQTFHSRLLIAIAQYERYHYQIYAGVKLNGDVCEMWGYNRGIENTYIENYGTPSYCRRLDELRDNELMFTHVEKGDARYNIQGLDPLCEDYKIISNWLNNPL